MEPGRDNHISDEDLERHSLNTLPEPQLAAVEEHLLVCPECQDRLEETDAYVEAMRAAALEARRETSSLRRPGRTRFFLAAAAGIAVLASVGVTMRWPRGEPPLPETVALVAVRGPMAAHSQAPAGRPLELGMDLTGLQEYTSYRVELVDHNGRRLWEEPASVQDGRLAVVVRKRLSPGRYYVRLYSPSAELLREFGLETR
jgi:hypothetical protein